MSTPLPTPPPPHLRAPWTPRAGTGPGRSARLRAEIPAALLILRAAGAAGCAWTLAALLHSHNPAFAALSGMLTVQLTLASSLRTAGRRLLAVLLGALLAITAEVLLAPSGWGVALLVAAALILGRVVRLGTPGAAQVPSSALLVLALGTTQPGYGLTRISDAALGAGVGLAVSLLAIPPVYVQPAADALADWAGEIAAVLALIAAELPTGLSTAPAWLAGARALDAARERTDSALTQGAESLRLNPRVRQPSVARAALRLARCTEWARACTHASVQLRGVARTLSDIRPDLPDAGPVSLAEIPLAAELAAMLAALAQLLSAAEVIFRADEPAYAPLEAALHAARSAQARFLTQAIEPAENSPEHAWWVYGPVLADVQRMIRELDLVAGPHADEDTGQGSDT